MAFRRTVSAYVLLLVAALALSGCERKVEFQLAPDIRRASEIAAVLSAQGIAVDRKPEKAGVMLSVADSEFPRAMTVLRDAGLLRASRPGADQALGKRPIAPTPVEEQARRIHGIERDLEATLMDIDGVIAARVRIVPPERPAPGSALTAPSASVLVKHRADIDLSPLLPGIVGLVKNGAPGLAGEDDRRVAVMLVPEQTLPLAAVSPASEALDRRTPMPLPMPIWVPLVCGAAAFGYFADRLLRRARRTSTNTGITGISEANDGEHAR